jgi:hypothetical protein
MWLFCVVLVANYEFRNWQPSIHQLNSSLPYAGSTVERQNQTDEVHLEVGEYLVVPTSTGIKLREHYAQYLSSTVNKSGLQGVERIRLTERDSRNKVVFSKEV